MLKCSYKTRCCTFCVRHKRTHSYQQIAVRLHRTTVEMMLENVSAIHADFAGASDIVTNLLKKESSNLGSRSVEQTQ